VPNFFAISFGSTPPNGDAYFNGISGPTNFGPGPGAGADSTSGPFVGLQPFNVPPWGITLIVPTGYTSGSLLAPSQDIFDNTTIAGIGITPGTYTWTWDNGLDSFTITTTPLPAALPLFATGLGGLGLLGWRRRRKAQAV
jgi:hypothetical protein